MLRGRREQNNDDESQHYHNIVAFLLNAYKCESGKREKKMQHNNNAIITKYDECPYYLNFVCDACDHKATELLIYRLQFGFVLFFSSFFFLFFSAGKNCIWWESLISAVCV